MFGQVRAIRKTVLGAVRDDRGFTLAELLISAVIMIVVAMGTLSALAFAATSTQASSVRDAALDVANKQLEYGRNLPYNSLGTQGGDPPGVMLSTDYVTTPQATYTITNEVTWIRDLATGRAKFKRVRVTVSWTVGIPGSVSVSTDVFGKTDLVNSGDLLIRTLKKQDNSPLQGSQVTITPSSGSARTVYTDAAGEAFFGMVPAGPVTISISNGAYVFDPSQYTGSVVTADLLNALTVYGQLPSHADVHIVGNPSGTDISGATVTLTDSSSNAVSQVTAANGIAHFDNLFIGTYSVRVTAPGRTTVSGQTLNIATEGSLATKTIQMTDPANLVVRVIDGGGNRLQGASVTVTGPSPSTSQVTGSPGTTGSNGEVSFASLVDGVYTVTVTNPGYANSSPVNVTMAGVGVTQIVMLTPASGPGSLLITVTRSNGTPVNGARLRVYPPTGGYTSYTANSSGQVAVGGLAPGNYNVRWRNSSNQWSSDIPVQITAGTQSSVNINSYQ